MQKILLFNLDFLKESEYEDSRKIIHLLNMLDELEDNENVICFYSRNFNDLRLYENKYKTKKFVFKTRNQIEAAVKKNSDKSNYFVVIGKKEQDFLLAVHSSLLFIVPTWLNVEEKADKYGVKVDNIEQLSMFIKSLNNQNYWYSKIEIDDITTVYSLMDAKSKYCAKSDEEKEMIENFQRLLKQGSSRSYYDILLYHFLSAITNIKIFDDIKIWGIIPSSDCTLNQDMLYFKDKVRYIKNGSQRNIEYNNVLIRHTEKNKAHYAGYDRKNCGASKEFQTIMINPEFQTKIKGLIKNNNFNVCIFDDYLTHGNSFESVRNLFKSLGAKRIICVSLGSFCKSYEKNDYQINGDVFSKTYKYKHIRHKQIFSSDFEINNSAKEEIESLYHIFNN